MTRAEFLTIVGPQFAWVTPRNADDPGHLGSWMEYLRGWRSWYDRDLEKWCFEGCLKDFRQTLRIDLSDVGKKIGHNPVTLVTEFEQWARRLIFELCQQKLRMLP